MIHVRPMTDDDLPLGMRLKARAGWNQTEADWRRALRLQPDGCFVAELDGAAVGTTTTCLFGPVAWVAMVLVDEAVRGRGVGTALMRHALAFLDERGVRGVRLDATPLGRPVYEKLGFVAEYTLGRYAGVLPWTEADTSGIAPVLPDDLASCAALDEQVTLTARGRLLSLLYEERPQNFRIDRSGRASRTAVAFLAARAGTNAIQIGPWLATRPDGGRRLLADVQRRYAGRHVFIDMPLPNASAVASVEALGLRPQRELLRMGRGVPVCENLDMLWASSGPEKG